MSITKAAIGIMYHIHQKKYPRDKILFDKTTIGMALNMVGHANNWNYVDYRKQVESNKSLLDYSKSNLKNLNQGKWEYNDLLYQVLASNMKDVANKFGEFMKDKAGDLYQEGNLYFKRGKSWKWEHTKNGEPLGPHGLWMEEQFAQKFGQNSKELRMSKKERTNIPKGAWNGIGKDKLKSYWNGWFFTDKNAYAIGWVVQVIALTEDIVKTQLYEENWNNDLSNYPCDIKWQFINRTEDGI